MKRKSLKEKLESFLAEPTPDGCRLWTGYVDSAGYGYIRVGSTLDGTRSKIGAHVAAFVLANNRPPAAGLFVLHKCNIKRCCTGDHLYEGTQKQNSIDWVNSDTWKKRGKDLKPRKAWKRKPFSAETREKMRISGLAAWARRKAGA